MGRKRRRLLPVIKRTLPKVFSCPRCGMASVRVNKHEDSIGVVCGSCSLSYTYDKQIKKEHIDIYNDFVDDFTSGKVPTL